MDTNLLYQLDKRVDEGWVKKQTHPKYPLLVYTYTEMCQYKQNWDKYTLMARGLIVDTKGSIVAKPFPKFFNIGEPSCPELPDLPYEAFEKMDGTLGIWFNYDNKWHCATRGSFTTIYSEEAHRYRTMFEPMKTWQTILTEVVIDPAKDGLRRVVLHDPGLYLLGATCLRSMADLDIKTLYSDWKGFLPKIESSELLELQSRQSEDIGTEGWIIRFSNGLRVKVKTKWYLKLFRMFSNVDNHVNEQIKLGTTLDQGFN